MRVVCYIEHFFQKTYCKELLRCYIQRSVSPVGVADSITRGADN